MSVGHSELEGVSFEICVVDAPGEAKVEGTLFAAEQKACLYLKGGGMEEGTSCLFEWRAWRDSFEGILQANCNWKKSHRMTGAEVVSTASATMDCTITQCEKVRTWSAWKPRRPSMAFFELQRSSILEDVVDSTSGLALSDNGFSFNMKAQKVEEIPYDKASMSVLRTSGVIVENWMGALFTPSNVAGIDEEREEATDSKNIHSRDVRSSACAINDVMSNCGTRHARSSGGFHGVFGKEFEPAMAKELATILWKDVDRKGHDPARALYLLRKGALEGVDTDCLGTMTKFLLQGT